MPASKQSVFCLQRQELVAAWEHDEWRLLGLSLSDQRIHHEFYLASETLPDRELVEHRRHVKHTDKSLRIVRSGLRRVRSLSGHEWSSGGYD